MNLRPSGYEPDELPDCSIPRLKVLKIKVFVLLRVVPCKAKSQNLLTKGKYLNLLTIQAKEQKNSDLKFGLEKRRSINVLSSLLYVNGKQELKTAFEKKKRLYQNHINLKKFQLFTDS